LSPVSLTVTKRANVFSAPAGGMPDGGLITTNIDLSQLVDALVGGRLVSQQTFTAMASAQCGGPRAWTGTATAENWDSSAASSSRWGTTGSTPAWPPSAPRAHQTPAPPGGNATDLCDTWGESDLGRRSARDLLDEPGVAVRIGELGVGAEVGSVRVDAGRPAVRIGELGVLPKSAWFGCPAVRQTGGRAAVEIHEPPLHSPGLRACGLPLSLPGARPHRRDSRHPHQPPVGRRRSCRKVASPGGLQTVWQGCLSATCLTDRVTGGAGRGCGHSLETWLHCRVESPAPRTRRPP
jgi:hypothetical protein